MSATDIECDATGIIPFFVYGTLMMADNGEGAWIADVDRVERHLIVTGYSLFVTHGHFPYAMKVENPNEFVFGELIWPADADSARKMTARFDSIEGHPHFYTRTLVEVTRNSRSTEAAWMYVFHTKHAWEPAALKSIGSSWRTWKSQNPQEDKGERPWQRPPAFA